MKNLIIVICLALFGNTILAQNADSVVVNRFKNGYVSSIIPYKNGEKNGWEYSFLEEGGLSTQVFYKNGIKNGLVLVYTGDGSLEVEAEFVNGKRLWSKSYNLDKSINTEKYFTDSLDSSYIIHIRDGKCEKGVYKEGKLIDKQIIDCPE
jgi:antitoxin component YwqK of YwqJK toxin-antitoxin module